MAAIFLGVIGSIDAIVEGTHDYKNDKETTSGFSSVLHDTNTANVKLNKTLVSLGVANNDLNEANASIGAANKNLTIARQQLDMTIKRGHFVDRSLQASLLNERRTIQIASSIIQKQQNLLASQRKASRGQVKILSLQTAQIATGEKALAQLDRTVNPLQVAKVAYAIKLPIERPELNAFKTNFITAYNKYLPQLRPGNEPAGCPFTVIGEVYHSFDGKSNPLWSTLGVAIHPDTDLYNSLPSSVTSYPITILAWRHHPDVVPTGEINAPADIVMNIVPSGRPQIIYNYSLQSFFLSYNEIQCEVIKPTGQIKALPELLGSYILIKRNRYDDQTKALSVTSLTDTQKMCQLHQISITIEGVPRIFVLGPRNTTYHKDIGNTSSFIFQDTPDELRDRSYLFKE